MPEGMTGEILVAVAVILCGSTVRRLGNRHAEQVAAVGELLRPVAIAEKAVVADAMEALGQDVQQEAANELVGRNGHDLLPIAVPVVLPAETHGVVLDVDEAVVGDGNAVRIAPDIVEYLGGPAKGGLAKTTHSAFRSGAK